MMHGPTKVKFKRKMSSLKIMRAKGFCLMKNFLRRRKNFYECSGLKHQREDKRDGLDVYCIRAVTITILVRNCRLIATV